MEGPNNTTQQKLNVVIYTNYKENNFLETTEHQRNKCISFLNNKGWTLGKEYHDTEDNEISPLKRPFFKQMLDDFSQKKDSKNIIVIGSEDILGSDFIYIIKTINVLDKNDILLYSALGEWINMRTEDRKYSRTIRFSLQEYNLNNLKKNRVAISQ